MRSAVAAQPRRRANPTLSATPSRSFAFSSVDCTCALSCYEAGANVPRPENTAAVVNGLIVLLGPFIFLVGGSLLVPDHTDTSTTVRAPGASPFAAFVDLATTAAAMAPGLVPLALIASWRTRVHAKTWLAHEGSGWRGVLEAGGCGFLIALAVLMPGIIRTPLLALPYVIAYGGVAFLLGLALGFVLRGAAVLTLRVHSD